MRILFVAYQEASNPLMMYSQGFPYIFGLYKKGVDLSVFTYETDKSLILSKEFFLANSSSFKWYFTCFNKGHSLFSVFMDITRGLCKAFCIILHDNIEIVHARGLMPALISFFPVRLLRRKLFFDTRGLLADKYVSGNIIIRHSLIYKLMKAAEKYLLRHCDFFTVETIRHSRIIDRWLPSLSNKKKIIPCCVDLNFFKYSKSISDASNIEIVYLGKTGTWHRIDSIFDFVNIAVNEFKIFSLLFLTPDDISAVIEMAKNKNVDLDKVKVINPTREKIPSLMSKASAGILFINPQHGYNSSHVKFGEYLACGLPVMVNKGIGDTTTIIEKERVGIILENFSVAEYKRAIRDLKAILSEGESLRARCRLVADKYFSLETGIREYWEIYRKLKNV